MGEVVVSEDHGFGGQELTGLGSWWMRIRVGEVAVKEDRGV